MFDIWAGGKGRHDMEYSRCVFLQSGHHRVSFYEPDVKQEPSEVISADANGRRSWLSADWATDGSAGVKPPVWNDINNHL